MIKTKAELELEDRVLMREQGDRGRLSLAVKRWKISVLHEVAHKLLVAGLSIEDVAKHTGLPLANVQELNFERLL